MSKLPIAVYDNLLEMAYLIMEQYAAQILILAPG